MSEICRQLQRLRTPPSLDFSKPHLSIDDASDGDDDGGGDDDHGAHAQYAMLGFSKPQIPLVHKLDLALETFIVALSLKRVHCPDVLTS